MSQASTAIQASAKSIKSLLKGVKYAIDYYQREYRWEKKQMVELIEDLTNRFEENYEKGHHRSQVREYSSYFLGSIILSSKDNLSYLVDGQQRLTSLSLLLIYLNNLQQNRPDKVNLDDMIYSDQFGEVSFNLNVKEREGCMNALFKQTPSFDESDQPESVQNLMARYRDIEDHFPGDLSDERLPFFIDWLIEKVVLVEISAGSDDEAYSIFETMNDRGLSLSPTDMLKGYLLANIVGDKRMSADTAWKTQIAELRKLGKEMDADAFKAWLRSQYANSIRERKRGAVPGDFDRIGTEFHRWVRDHREQIGLTGSDDFSRLIETDFRFYSRQFQRLIKASRELTDGLEHVLYNAHHGFTQQYMMLLAPLRPEDSEPVVTTKLRLVGRYLDILINRRHWNFKSITYSTMQYNMYTMMRNIRALAPENLARRLYDDLAAQDISFETGERLYLHTQNRKILHRILARLTARLEAASGQAERYGEYVSEGRNRYEVEHIWANHYEGHEDEFAHPNEFADYRNKIGGLLLLPKSFNASYGDMPYEQKLEHYNTQNLLARSLHPQCYENNPGFLRYARESGLPFKAHAEFTKADLDARGALYRQLAAEIWNPELLLQEVEA